MRTVEAILDAINETGERLFNEILDIIDAVYRYKGCAFLGLIVVVIVCIVGAWIFS